VYVTVRRGAVSVGTVVDGHKARPGDDRFVIMVMMVIPSPHPVELLTEPTPSLQVTTMVFILFSLTPLFKLKLIEKLHVSLEDNTKVNPSFYYDIGCSYRACVSTSTFITRKVTL